MRSGKKKQKQQKQKKLLKIVPQQEPPTPALPMELRAARWKLDKITRTFDSGKSAEFVGVFLTDDQDTILAYIDLVEDAAVSMAEGLLLTRRNLRSNG